MSHTDSSALAAYNSLMDPHLGGYFSNLKMRTHLKKSGLITKSGEIVSENTYRLNMARKEHKKHVRDLLAQAIVHKTLDMERNRQVVIRQKLEEIAKMELVRRVRGEPSYWSELFPQLIKPALYRRNNVTQTSDDCMQCQTHLRKQDQVDRSRKGDEEILPYLTPRPKSAKGSRQGSRPTSGKPVGGRPKSAPSRGRDRSSSPADDKIVILDDDGIPVSPRSGSSSNTSTPRGRSPPKKSKYPRGELDDRHLYSLNQQTLREYTMARYNIEHGQGPSPYTMTQLPSPPQSGRPKSARRGGGTGRNRRTVTATDAMGRPLRPKSNKGSVSLHRKEPPMRHQDKPHSNVEVTIHYFGSSLKLDCEKFDPRDEVLIEQQHCGGNTLPVYREKILPGSCFVFTSRRHRGFPFGLTFYVNGLEDCRLSACCEYKHRLGSKLGGKHGHFGIRSIKGAAPCYKCQVSDEMRDSESKPRRGKQSRKTEQEEQEVEVPVEERGQKDQTDSKAQREATARSEYDVKGEGEESTQREKGQDDSIEVPVEDQDEVRDTKHEDSYDDDFEEENKKPGESTGRSSTGRSSTGRSSSSTSSSHSSISSRHGARSRSSSSSSRGSSRSSSSASSRSSSRSSTNRTSQTKSPDPVLVHSSEARETKVTSPVPVNVSPRPAVVSPVQAAKSPDHTEQASAAHGERERRDSSESNMTDISLDRRSMGSFRSDSDGFLTPDDEEVQKQDAEKTKKAAPLTKSPDPVLVHASEARETKVTSPVPVNVSPRPAVVSPVQAAKSPDHTEQASAAHGERERRDSSESNMSNISLDRRSMSFTRSDSDGFLTPDDEEARTQHAEKAKKAAPLSPASSRSTSSSSSSNASSLRQPSSYRYDSDTEQDKVIVATAFTKPKESALESEPLVAAASRPAEEQRESSKLALERDSSKEVDDAVIQKPQSPTQAENSSSESEESDASESSTDSDHSADQASVIDTIPSEALYEAKYEPEATLYSSTEKSDLKPSSPPSPVLVQTPAPAPVLVTSTRTVSSSDESSDSSSDSDSDSDSESEKGESQDTSAGAKPDKTPEPVVSQTENKDSIRSQVEGRSDLELTGRQLTPQQVDELCACIRENETVQSLTLRNSGLDDASVGKLAGVLVNTAPSTDLRLLNLNCNNMTEAAVPHLLSILTAKTDIKILLMHGNPLGNNGVAELIKGLVQTHQFRLSDEERLSKEELQNIRSTAQDLVSDLMKEVLHTSTASTDSQQSQTASGGLPLTQLDIGDCGMTEKGAVSVADLISANTNIRTLGLTGNKNIGITGWLALADALRNNTHILSLSLDYNDLGDAGAAILAEALRENTSIKELDLEGNKIGEEGANRILEMLEENKVLQDVTLFRGNNISDETLEKINRALKK